MKAKIEVDIVFEVEGEASRNRTEREPGAQRAASFFRCPLLSPEPRGRVSFKTGKIGSAEPVICFSSLSFLFIFFVQLARSYFIWTT